MGDRHEGIAKLEEDANRLVTQLADLKDEVTSYKKAASELVEARRLLSDYIERAEAHAESVAKKAETTIAAALGKAEKPLEASKALLDELRQAKAQFHKDYQQACADLYAYKQEVTADAMRASKAMTQDWLAAQKDTVDNVTARAQEAMGAVDTLMDRLRQAERNVSTAFMESVKNLDAFKQDTDSELKAGLAALTDRWFSEHDSAVKAVLAETAKSLAEAAPRLEELKVAEAHFRQEYAKAVAELDAYEERVSTELQRGFGEHWKQVRDELERQRQAADSARHEFQAQIAARMDNQVAEIAKLGERLQQVRTEAVEHRAAGDRAKQELQAQISAQTDDQAKGMATIRKRIVWLYLVAGALAAALAATLLWVVRLATTGR